MDAKDLVKGAKYRHANQSSFPGEWVWTGRRHHGTLGQGGYFSNGVDEFSFNLRNVSPVEDAKDTGPDGLAVAVPVADPVTVTGSHTLHWKAFQHSVPGECPCGINRKDCGYHS